MGTATIRLTDVDGKLEMQTTYDPPFDPVNYPSHDHADTLLRGLAQIAEPIGEPVSILLAGDRRPVKTPYVAKTYGEAKVFGSEAEAYESIVGRPSAAICGHRPVKVARQ